MRPVAVAKTVRSALVSVPYVAAPALGILTGMPTPTPNSGAIGVCAVSDGADLDGVLTLVDLYRMR